MVSRIPPPDDGSPRRQARPTGRPRRRPRRRGRPRRVVLQRQRRRRRRRPDGRRRRHRCAARRRPVRPRRRRVGGRAVARRHRLPRAEPVLRAVTDGSEEPAAPPTSAPSVDPSSGLPTVYLLDLPPEAAETVESIERGRPTPTTRTAARSATTRACCPTASAATTRSSPSRRPGPTTAARAASSRAPRASCTGPTTTTRRSRGSCCDRTRLPAGEPRSSPGCTAGPPHLDAAYVGGVVRRSGGRFVHLPARHRPAPPCTTRWPRRSSCRRTTGATSTRSPTACATCPPAAACRWCSGTTADASPSASRASPQPSSSSWARRPAWCCGCVRSERRAATGAVTPRAG